MARWVPGFLERKDDASQRAVAQPLFAFGHPYLSNWNLPRAIREAYERVTWVFRAIDAIASNAARLPVQARVDHPDLGELIDPKKLPDLRRLNVRTNIWESAAQFRYRLSTLLLLSKAGVFVEVQRDNAGRLLNAYILPTQYTYPIPDPDHFVAGYRVWVGGVQPVDIPAGQVVWIRKPHPSDPYSGVTPLEAAGITVDMDFYAHLYQRVFMANDGRMGGIAAIKGYIGKGDAKKLQDRFNGGPQNAGRVAVIEAESVSWIDTAVVPRDAQYVESRKLSKEEILLAFGVPESIIGNASARTFANADAEKEIFWRETMLPHLDVIADGFDRILGFQSPTGEQDTGADQDRFTGFNLDTIAVLKRDQREQEKHEMTLVQGGFAPLDEARKRVGREPLDIPASRSLWVPTAVQLIPESEADRPALMPAPSPQGAATVQAAQVHADGQVAAAKATAKAHLDAAKRGMVGPVPGQAPPGVNGNGNGNGAAAPNGNGVPVQLKALGTSPTAAGLAVIARDSGRVLMLQRSSLDDDDPAAGTWEFPGGCLEPNESALAGARREWCEETGAPPPEGELAGSWDSPNGVYRGFILLVPSEDAVPINTDHDRRAVLNPDDPDGDDIEVAAWWDVEHARDNPALRSEARTTDWNALLRASLNLKALPPGTGPGGALISGQPHPPRGVRVGAFLDPDVARAIAHPHGEDPAKLHVTLAYLGQTSNPDIDLQKAASAVDGVTSQHPALEGEVTGTGTFDKVEDDQKAHVALLDVPGLNRLRESVVEALKAAGQPVAEDHGFTPHVTLRYAPHDDDEGAPVVPNAPVRIHRLTLAAGDQLQHFSLRGQEELGTKFAFPVLALKAGDQGQALIDWYNAGADGQIDWGSDGDFDQCVAVASQYMDDDQANGFCQLRHMDATGMTTAEHAHDEKKALR